MCPIVSLHYGFLCTQCKGPRKYPHKYWFLAWMWVIYMLLNLNGPFSDQLIHLWDTTIPYCLSNLHISLWLCVFAIIQRDHMVKINYKSFPFYLSLVFHLHPALANCLNFVSMAWHIQETSRGFNDYPKTQVYLIVLLFIVTMIMNNIDLSLVLIYTIGAFLTLDTYMIIWI